MPPPRPGVGRSSSSCRTVGAPVTPEPVDPLEPVEDRLALVHVPSTVAGRGRTGAQRLLQRCASDGRAEAEDAARGPSSSRSRSSTSSTRPSERSAATSARRTASVTDGPASSPSSQCAAQLAVEKLLVRILPLLEEHGTAQRPGLTELRRAPALRAAALRGMGRSGTGQQLPAVERLCQRRIAVGIAECGQDAGGDRRAERVEPRSLAGGLRWRRSAAPAGPVRTPVQGLDEDGPGGKRPRGREPHPR